MYEFDEKRGFLLKSDELKKPALLTASFGMGVRGDFRALLWNANGTLAQDSGWNSNLIVDNGLNNLYDNWYSWYTWCCIGSGSTAPATGNTTIQTFLGSNSSGSNPMPFVAYPRPRVAPNYEHYSIKKWRFAAGVGTGTVREFTLGNVNDGTNIFCRHVLPSAIPKAADQVLDIFYRFYVYLDLTPRVGTVTIKGVLYDWTASFYKYDGNPTSDLFAHYDLNSTFSSNFRAWNTATPGTISADPVGTAYGNAIKSFLTQSGATRTNRLTAGLDDWITPSGRINLLTATNYQGHYLQIRILDAATGTLGFPKDNTEQCIVDWKTTWARYP